MNDFYERNRSRIELATGIFVFGFFGALGVMMAGFLVIGMYTVGSWIGRIS